jgi:sigma-B regulation protein RsbU (phosphoserine phosphatase)
MTLDELLTFIVNQLVETVGADRGTLYLVEEDVGELYSRVLLQDTGDLKEIRLKVGEGVSGHVAMTGQTLNIRHAYEDARFARSFDRVTGYTSDSMLTVPMRNPQQKIIGVVQLLNKKVGGFFTDHDERLLTAMASQAAVCIENARLYRQEILQQVTLRELEMARRIQESFLPREALRVPGFDIAGVCMYCDKTGGDYYDFFRVGPEDEDRFALVVGDVSGHGLSAALLMASARGLIRLRAAMPGEAAEIVRDVNRQLCRDTDETGQFMTLFYGDVNARQGMLNWVTAGHDSPLLYDRRADAFADLAGQGLALGLFEDFAYTAFQRRLEPGQILLIGTDGIWETHNRQGEMFGKTALKDVLRANADRSAQDTQAAVIEALKRFRGEQPLEDDVTMVVVKVLPGVEKALDPTLGRL